MCMSSIQRGLREQVNAQRDRALQDAAALRERLDRGSLSRAAPATCPGLRAIAEWFSLPGLTVDVAGL